MERQNLIDVSFSLVLEKQSAEMGPKGKEIHVSPEDIWVPDILLYNK